jgi:hypothetical protein
MQPGVDMTEQGKGGVDKRVEETTDVLMDAATLLASISDCLQNGELTGQSIFVGWRDGSNRNYKVLCAKVAKRCGDAIAKGTDA